MIRIPTSPPARIMQYLFEDLGASGPASGELNETLGRMATVRVSPRYSVPFRKLSLATSFNRFFFSLMKFDLRAVGSTR